jgi:FixJ family two-component response regulator
MHGNIQLLTEVTLKEGVQFLQKPVSENKWILKIF